VVSARREPPTCGKIDPAPQIKCSAVQPLGLRHDPAMLAPCGAAV
jgi:hypothetical protein